MVKQSKNKRMSFSYDRRQLISSTTNISYFQVLQQYLIYSTFLLMINKGAESLLAKDAQAYKQLAKYYDAKNYKKGLKNAEKLLETHPDHPETLALKALFLQATNEQNKALEVAKLALIKSKMKSMFCWHTCGSIYKQKKDFLQAAKCFQNALRLEPDNNTLMRETACLQIQVRDHTNHVASRYAILKQKPNLIQNWVSFTLAHHLRGDFPSLFKALVSLDNLIKTTQLKPTQLAHYYLYRVITYRDAENYQKMYEELHRNKNNIKDLIMYHELLYHASSQLGKKEQAASSLQFVMKKFPENLEYLTQYQNLNHVSRREACSKLKNDFKSKIAHIHQLSCIQDRQQFKRQFQKFIKAYYQKNLISLYTEIQVIYEAGRYADIQEVFLKFEASLEKNVYPDGSQAISPSQYLWSLYFLAQHYSQRFETLSKAYDYIQKALKHTCTVSEFYLVKAEIQYKQHNNLLALKTINQARKTDLADRYMNNICVKFLMKCEKPDFGEIVLRIFMRDDASLYDLQNHWYIIEAGKSFLKQRNFEAGLRHLDFVNKQFLDFQSNEFDFHTYCIRRWTLREYVQLIQFNDNIYDDKKYAETAGIAIRYLKEYVHKLQEDEINAAKKIQQETKEEKEAKKKKKKKKAEQAAQEESPLDVFRNKVDYFGKQYSEKIKKNPLQEALNYAKCVSTIKFTNKGNIAENKLFGRAFAEAIDIFIHFKKPLLVLRCINKLLSTNSCPFTIHNSIIKAVAYLQSYLTDPKANDLAKEIISQFLENTLKGKSLNEYNDAETKKWNESVSIQLQYLVQTKKTEASIILKNPVQFRNELIEFYLKELIALSTGQAPSPKELQLIFYFTHRLQFFGRLSEDLKSALKKRVGSLSSYFSDWRNQIPKLPESTWSAWWLSDYDIEREELQDKLEKQKAEEGKKGEKKA